MIPIKNRRIVLIGGAGFIGHNMALRFKELGADVSIIDSLYINNFLSFTSAESNSNNKDIYLRIFTRTFCGRSRHRSPRTLPW